MSYKILEEKDDTQGSPGTLEKLYRWEHHVWDNSIGAVVFDKSVATKNGVEFYGKPKETIEEVQEEIKDILQKGGVRYEVIQKFAEDGKYWVSGIKGVGTWYEIGYGFYLTYRDANGILHVNRGLDI